MPGFVFAAVLAAAFTNDIATLEIDRAGRVTSLRERESGRELVTNRVSFCWLQRNGRRVYASSAVPRAHDALAFAFSDAAGELVLSFRSFGGGWTITAETCTVDSAAFDVLVPVRIQPMTVAHKGDMLNMLSDDRSGVVVRAYDESMAMALDVTGVFARTDVTKDVAGHRFGLVAGPREKLIPALKGLQRETGTVLSEAGGAWSLEAPVNRLSTLFCDMTEASCDSWIDFARRGGFGILHFSRWWTLNGAYPIRTEYFPSGLDGLVACARKAQAAGLLTGMHTYTGAISAKSPCVSEHPRDLIVRTGFTYRLAAPLGAGETDSLRIDREPEKRHDTFLGYSSNGNALRIGDEIIQYSDISREPPYGFGGLVRGAFGTKAAAHAAGEEVGYLQQRYVSFYPRGDRPLADALAARLGEVYRACGHSDCYFDASEGLGSRHEVDVVRGKIFDALGGSPVIESSNGNAHGWRYRSRLGTWDHPRWAAKRFHDRHVRDLVELRQANLMAVQSGWWKPRTPDAAGRGQFPDEMEYFAAKNAANDLPCTIHSLSLYRHPLEPGVLRLTELFGTYERFRVAKAFSPAALARIRTPGEDYRLRRNAAGNWTFCRADTHVHRVTGREDGSSAWTETVGYPVRGFALRVEALSAAAADAGTNSTVLLEASDPARRISAKGVKAEVATVRDGEHGDVTVLRGENRAAADPRGAWAAAEFDFKPYRDIGTARAFGLWVKGDGKGELLNVQPNAPREYGAAKSEHYLKIDFTGWRYVTFLLSERDADRCEEWTWPYDPQYLVYRNTIDPKHVSRIALYLNGIPKGGTCEVAVSRIRALETVSVTRTGAAVELNGVRIPVPFGMRSGEYAELEGGTWMHYAADGTVLGESGCAIPAKAVRGGNRLAFDPGVSADGSPRAEVTFVPLGDEFPALR